MLQFVPSLKKVGHGRTPMASLRWSITILFGSSRVGTERTLGLGQARKSVPAHSTAETNSSRRNGAAAIQESGIHTATSSSTIKFPKNLGVSNFGSCSQGITKIAERRSQRLTQHTRAGEFCRIWRRSSRYGGQQGNLRCPCSEKLRTPPSSASTSCRIPPRSTRTAPRTTHSPSAAAAGSPVCRSSAPP